MPKSYASSIRRPALQSKNARLNAGALPEQGHQLRRAQLRDDRDESAPTSHRAGASSWLKKSSWTSTANDRLL